MIMKIVVVLSLVKHLQENNMKVKELKECDIQLTDITEKEYNAMFIEGLKVLVKEARDGKVGDYIVLPYEDTPDLFKENSKNTVKVDDEDADALVQVGAVSMIMKGIKEMENNEKGKV